MRASLLLQREPLPQIAVQTIAAFWKLQFRQEFDVQWFARGATVPPNAGQLWLANHLVNGIFRPRTSREAFDPIEREFSHSPVAWRRPLQQLYVRLALQGWSAPLLAHSRLTISPAVPDSHDWIIVPGNNKFRFLNHVKRLSYGIIKSQFPAEAVRCEIEARTAAAAHGVSIPELIDVAQDGSWFCERYLSGTPANRLRNCSQVRQLVLGAARQLAAWSRVTATEVPAEYYVESLIDQLGQLLRRVGCGTELFAESLQRLAEQLAELACAGKSLDSVVISWTHGDFQDANILVAERGSVVIDWEFAGKRQEAFDGLVYDLRSRFPTGLAERLIEYTQHGAHHDGMLAQVYQSPNNRPLNREARAAQLAIFLLEELLLRIGQAVDRPLFALPQGIELVVEQATRWLERQAVCV